MNFTTELIVLSIVIILLFIRPNALVKFSKSIIGKVVFVSTIILSSSMNPLIGLFFATLMILLLETSYEGFKEGLSLVNDLASPVSVTTFGKTNAGSNEIVLYSADDLTDISTNEVDLSGSYISPNTLITEILDTSSIFIEKQITYTSLPGDISFVKVDSITTFTSTETGQGSYDISFIYSGSDTPTSAILEPPSINPTSYIVQIGSNANDVYLIQNSNIGMRDDTDGKVGEIKVVTSDYSRKLIHSSVDGPNSYLTFEEDTPQIQADDYAIDLNDNVAYKVVDVSNTFKATIATKTNSDIDHNTSLDIVSHKHDFAMGYYDKSHTHNQEGFTSYNEAVEKITEVKPYQEPEITFLSDLTGETVCSTNLCDRIDAETKIIFPIFSNNHCPTNI